MIDKQLVNKLISLSELDSFEQTLSSATSQPISVFGTSELKFNIGNKFADHRVVIADITQNAILGMDFLTLNYSLINAGRRTLTIQGKSYPLITSRLNQVSRGYG